jgi:hypothetical protein
MFTYSSWDIMYNVANNTYLLWMWLHDVLFCMCERSYLSTYCCWRAKMVRHGRDMCKIAHCVIFLIWMVKHSKKTPFFQLYFSTWTHIIIVKNDPFDYNFFSIFFQLITRSDITIESDSHVFTTTTITIFDHFSWKWHPPLKSKVIFNCRLPLDELPLLTNHDIIIDISTIFQLSHWVVILIRL